ncbi:MAG: DUF3299 domain-containing protein [Gammaproteobacteria bacterium]|nr:DUF3299 domain-containing protein [Gammaproteobacteria bacterium]
MPMLSRIPGFLLMAIAAWCAPAAAGPAPRELGWEDLMPPAIQAPAPAFPGSGIPGKDGADRTADAPGTLFYSSNPVHSLNGQYVKLPGYIVPLESDEGGLLQEFLLVPYFGACIHVPPPPPNQIVYVRLSKPFDFYDMSQPYWIIGTISTKRWAGEVADTDYVMAGDRIEMFRY